MKTKTIEERFWNKVSKKSPESCWEWTAARGRQGYGCFVIAGKLLKAHRVSWEFANGEIPNGMFVLHSCDNPPCVNPSHLHLGNVKTNSDEKVSRGRQPKGESNGRSKLTEKEVKEIRRLRKSGEILRNIASLFNIHISNVSFITRKDHWKFLK